MLNFASATSPLVIVLDEVHMLSGYDETIGTARLNLLRRAMHAHGLNRELSLLSWASS